ncbi:iron complex transport system substrate-binding protein [Methylopila capsulata]|uniref:Amino acid ABC transporter substrate-binding protein n=1 Tax=Methylopila capsulata TaxID=61654 RepID=A0A9W6IX79_9HYPH|nr:ABC transporter substrate-binding protein [Methylopila capsulata]MBM7852613.1 iron complex transport system substrate-binding protein [Methylopila capsulata]GLK56820.1 amino acid ABC transporter substrate-binding protein [Methylopila capsulata]
MNGPYSLGLTRRALITSLAATGLAGSLVAPAGAANLRVAAIDWAMLETALALGVTPVAATELKLFRRAAIEPAVPAEVADLGLRGEINAEMLLYARPELILSSPWYEKYRAQLERVAPVESFSIYEPGRSPYAAAEAASRALGARLSRAAEAEALVARADAALGERRARLAPFADRPFLMTNFGDIRHFRAFGADSLFADVLARLGLRSAWAGGSAYGAVASVGLEALAAMPEAWIVIVGPTPPDVLRSLNGSAFWRAMPQVAGGRVIDLGPVNPFGALPAALRFARLLDEALAGRDHA